MKILCNLYFFYKIEIKTKKTLLKVNILTMYILFIKYKIKYKKTLLKIKPYILHRSKIFFKKTVIEFDKVLC
jgi:hypothetical protein